MVGPQEVLFHQWLWWRTIQLQIINRVQSLISKILVCDNPTRKPEKILLVQMRHKDKMAMEDPSRAVILP